MKGRNTNSPTPSFSSSRALETSPASLLGLVADHLGAFALLGLGFVAAAATFGAMA